MLPTLLVFFLVSGLASGLTAQGRAEPKATDVRQFEENTYRHLFNGIRLDATSERRARKLISEHTRAQEAVDKHAPDAWDQRISLMRRRDSALRTLLRTDADRKQFDQNADGPRRMEAMRPPRRPEKR